MATQGVLSIVEDGIVILKLVTGSEGMRIPELRDWIEDYPKADAAAIYDKAFEFGIGGDESLIVQLTSIKHLPKKAKLIPGSLYEKQFYNPTFNPRWCSGESDYLAVIER